MRSAPRLLEMRPVSLLSCGAGVMALLAFASPLSAERTELTVPVSASEVDIASDAQGWSGFSGADTQRLSLTGEPDIPWRVINLLLPPDALQASVTVRPDGMVWEKLEGQWSVAPAPPLGTWPNGQSVLDWPTDRAIVQGRDAAIYGRAAYWPSEDVRLLSVGRLRKWRLVQLAVPLVKHDPVGRALQRVSQGSIVVSFERTGQAQFKAKPQAVAELVDRIGDDTVRRLAVNYDEQSREYEIDSEASGTKASPLVNPAVNPRYVIITTSAIQTASTKLASFVAHKQSQGFDVSVVTEGAFGGGTGNTAAENIRTWLQNHYISDNIEYLLLIGNPHPTTGTVPMKMLYPRGPSGTDVSAPSDLYYADLTGNWNLDGDAYYGEYTGDFGIGGVDRFWEVIVGRIPYYGTIADLDSILQKIMDYQNQPAGSVAWRRSALLPMRDPDDWTAAHWFGEQIKTDLLTPAGWSWNRVYQSDTGLSPPPETMPCTTTNVTNVWKNGAFGLVLWLTHGSATSALDVMDTSYAAQLNDGHPSFTFQCSCNNAYPEVTNNLCYTLLKKGAVCTIGDTRVSWYEVGQNSFKGSASNAGLAYEYASRLVTDNMTTGHAIFDVTMVLSPSTDKKWMNFCDFSINGDPATYLIPRCGRRYVKVDAAPDGDGTSWPSAYRDLQSALDERATEIWVAAGTYKPDRGAGGRAASFSLGYQTALYGGFAGTETNRDERNPAVNVTILSGDLVGDDGPNFTNNAENSYNVLISRGCDARSVLDGFTIKGGNASNMSSAVQCRGAGLYNQAGSSPTITNCVFTGNGAAYAGGAVYNASPAASPTIVHCTFSGNQVSGNGGAICSSSSSRARISDCLFTGNSCTSYGGAMDGTTDYTTFVNCDFIGNSSKSGGGGAIRLYGSSTTFMNCRFLGNSAKTYGGAFYNDTGSPTLVNALFSGCTAAGSGGGAIWSTGTGNLRITNSTIVGNAATGTFGNGGGLSLMGGTCTLTNAIFWSNRDKSGVTQAAQLYKSTGAFALNYSCVQFWSAALDGTGNTDIDPLLADPDGNDNIAGTDDDNAHLLPGSSAIDSGSNSAVPADAADLDADGNTSETLPLDLESHVRFADDANTVDTGSGPPPIVDMGVYEGPSQGFVLSTRSLNIPEATNATFTIWLALDPGQPVPVSVAPESGDTDIIVLSGGSWTFDSTNYALPHTVMLRANPDGDNLAGTATIAIAASGLYTARVVATERDDEPVTNVLRVDIDATGANTGGTWVDAYSDLRTALAMAAAHSNVTEIRVAQGTYRPAGVGGARDAAFELRKGLVLRGGYAGVGHSSPDARDANAYSAILSGDLAADDSAGFVGNGENSYHVVVATDTDATAVLDGFTVTGGSANGTGDQANGGGILIGNGNPTLLNCTFILNAASVGAGLHKDQTGSLALRGCRFIGNAASGNGGGVYCQNVDATIIACRFLGNTSAGYGGAAFLSGGSVPLVASCLFSGNSADRGGGLYESASGLSVINCTFTLNWAISGAGGLQSVSDSTVVANCIFWNNYRDGGWDEYAQINGCWLIDYCCVQEWTGEMSEGEGNHGDNPMFADADGLDHIAGTADDNPAPSAGSPCIDAGNNDLVPAGVTTDVRGAARFMNDPDTSPDPGHGSPPIVDRGADEFGPLALGDFDTDGDVDADDLVIFRSCAGRAACAYASGCTLTPDREGKVAADFDRDSDVDLDDFGVFQRWYTGPSGSPRPADGN